MRKEQWQTKSHIQSPIHEVRESKYEVGTMAEQRHIYNHQCTK